MTTDLLPRGFDGSYSELLNEFPRPNADVGRYLDLNTGPGSVSGGHPLGYWLEAIDRHGHAVLDVPSYAQPWYRRVIGCGIRHDDAVFAETGGRVSEAAYSENDVTHRPRSIAGLNDKHTRPREGRTT